MDTHPPKMIKKRKYEASTRVHDPAWMIHHVKDLLTKATKQHDSSKLLYACYELRNCIEFVEFRLILASLEKEEREEMFAIAKPRNGIERANKNVKSLSSKFQVFYATVANVYGIKGNAFDFHKSSEFKSRLNEYLHCYTYTEDEMAYGSTHMMAAIPLIKDAVAFLEHSLNKDDKAYTLQNLSITTLSDADKQILKDWKDGKIKNDGELEELLKIQKADYEAVNGKESTKAVFIPAKAND